MKVIQFNSIRSSLQSALENRTLVEVEMNDDTGNGKFTGFIINLSYRFATLQVIEDWHSDGVQFLPLDRICSIRTSELHFDRERILVWNGVGHPSMYDDIEIDSFETIFDSIQRRNGVVMIEDFESTEVGKILNFENESLTIKGIDGAGQWLEEDVVRPFSDIWYVIYDDEYSRVLGSYVESQVNC